MADHEPVDILLVDDNRAKIMALRAALAPLAENVVEVHSGRDALRQLLGRTFATIILDVNMPDLDGFQTAELIRGRPASAQTPIIFVSAVNMTDADVLRGYAMGAVDYITAPVVAEVLRAKVSVFVGLYRKTEEARRHLAEVERRTAQLEASQQQLRLAERMAALGTLSAGVGHDMGNLLLPIQAQIDSLDLGSTTPDVRQCVSSIAACIKHLRRLAGGLRLLALDPERSTSSQETTDLSTWWPEIEPVLKNVLPPAVTLSCSLTPDLPRVRIAAHLLSQVVFNLVQNAADAMRSSGGRGAVRLWARPEGDTSAVRIGASDNGPGMTDEVRKRCLEPFFTTKSRSLSTGLGLSLVNGIVQRAGGELNIESCLGEGTTFSFAIPSAPAPRADPARCPVQAAISVSDPRWRSLARMILREHGVSLLDAPQEIDGPGVLLLDAAEARRGNPSLFVQRAPGRRVVVLGGSPDEVPPEFLVVPDGPGLPSLLRAALGKAVAACGSSAAAAAAPGALA